MEFRIAKTDVPECDIEVGLSVSGIGTTQPRTAAVGAS
jgi:hypothetical protein